MTDEKLFEFNGKVFTKAERDAWIKNEVEREFAEERDGWDGDLANDEAWYRLELFYEFVPITAKKARRLQRKLWRRSSATETPGGPRKLPVFRGYTVDVRLREFPQG